MPDISLLKLSNMIHEESENKVKTYWSFLIVWQSENLAFLEEVSFKRNMCNKIKVKWLLAICAGTQTTLTVFYAGKCPHKNIGSTIDSIVLAKVVQGRSSRETARNTDWACWDHRIRGSLANNFCQQLMELAH